MQSIKLSDLYNASRKDKSAMALVFSNVIVIIFALAQGWNLLVIMLGYWLQSVIIGFFNFFKIISLKEFSVKGLKIGDESTKATSKTKRFVAIFFVFHYGFFHLIYLAFLAVFIKAEGTDMNKEIFPVLTMGVIFFFNHLFSFWYNRRELRLKLNIGKIMSYPYARIIPMHFTIIAGGSFFVLFKSYQTPLVLFLFLKTIADLIMHIVEHRGFEDSSEEEAGGAG